MQPTAASGSGDTASGSFRLSSGDAVLAAGEYADGVQVPVPHAAASYRLDYDVTRSAPWWTLSTTTHTEWTFTSGPNSANLPPGWFCDLTAATSCNVLPLIFADYRLPVDDTGHEPAGAVTGEIDVHHLQGASQVSIASLGVQVSFDDGLSWEAAAVTALSPGRFDIDYTNPASAGTAALRLTARDAQGNTLTEVVHQAYRITPSG